VGGDVVAAPCTAAAEALRVKNIFTDFFFEERPEACGKGSGKIKDYNGGISRGDCSRADFRVFKSEDECKSQSDVGCAEVWDTCALNKLVRQNHNMLWYHEGKKNILR
jgi:hypothetical protein